MTRTNEYGYSYENAVKDSGNTDNVAAVAGALAAADAAPASTAAAVASGASAASGESAAAGESGELAEPKPASAKKNE